MAIDFTCFNWVQLVKKSKLSPNAKYIAMYLSTFMNMETDIAWPSQARISDETGLSKSTVVRKLQELCQEGWLLSKKAAHPVNTGHQQYLHNEYIIQIPGSVREQIRDSMMPPQGRAGVSNNGTRGVKKGVAGVSPSVTNNNRITKNNNTENFPFWNDNQGWQALGEKNKIYARQQESWDEYKNRVKRMLIKPKGV